MNNYKNKYRMWIKIIAMVVVCLFTIETIAWAAPPDTNQGIQHPVLNNTETIKTPGVEYFTIPSHLGEIKDTFKGTSGKLVIHLQDAHCNYSCQHAIADTIEHLNNTYDVDLVALEGGAGNYDLSSFTDIEDNALREKVTDYFVKEGRINGAEFFAITNPGKVTLKGLEKPKLYFANLEAYRESLKHKEEVDRILNTLDNHLSGLKQHIYTEKLKAFDQKRTDFEDKKLELNEYLSYLVSLSSRPCVIPEFADLSAVALAKAEGEYPGSIQEYKNLHKLIETIKQEKKIDFKRANSERDILIDELTKWLSSLELEILVKKSVEFKEGKITQTQFYSYLFKKAESIDININIVYPNLSKYKEYIDIYNSLDSRLLFNEIERFEDEIVENLCVNDTQKELYTRSKNLTLLKNFFNITLTPDKYEYYQKNKASFAVETIMKITDVGGASGPEQKFAAKGRSYDIVALDTYREKMEKFYQLAFKRDTTFVKNITSYSKNKDTLIVVSGGFHGENLKHLLKQKGYSYISIVPKFDGNEENPYFKLLNGDENSLLKVIEASMSSLAIGSILSEMKVLEVLGDDNDFVQHAVNVLVTLEKGEEITLPTVSGSVTFSREAINESSEEKTQVNGYPVYTTHFGDEKTEKKGLTTGQSAVRAVGTFGTKIILLLTVLAVFMYLHLTPLLNDMIRTAKTKELIKQTMAALESPPLEDWINGFIGGAEPPFSTLGTIPDTGVIEVMPIARREDTELELKEDKEDDVKDKDIHQKKETRISQGKGEAKKEANTGKETTRNDNEQIISPETKNLISRRKLLAGILAGTATVAVAANIGIDRYNRYSKGLKDPFTLGTEIQKTEEKILNSSRYQWVSGKLREEIKRMMDGIVPFYPPTREVNYVSYGGGSYSSEYLYYPDNYAYGSRRIINETLDQRLDRLSEADAFKIYLFLQFINDKKNIKFILKEMQEDFHDEKHEKGGIFRWTGDGIAAAPIDSQGEGDTHFFFPEDFEYNNLTSTYHFHAPIANCGGIAAPSDGDVGFSACYETSDILFTSLGDGKFNVKFYVEYKNRGMLFKKILRCIPLAGLFWWIVKSKNEPIIIDLGTYSVDGRALLEAPEQSSVLPLNVGKGCLRFIAEAFFIPMRLLKIEITPFLRTVVENGVVPVIEELGMLLALGLGSPILYVKIRIGFILLHSIERLALHIWKVKKGRAPPVGIKRVLYEKIIAPAIVPSIASIAATLPLVLAALSGATPSLTAVLILGTLTHILSNYIITLLEQIKTTSKKLPEDLRVIKYFLPAAQLEKVPSMLEDSNDRIELCQTLTSHFQEFAKRAHIVRGGPSNESTSKALAFLITLQNNPLNIKTSALSASLDKKEVDNFIAILDTTSKQEIFKYLNTLADTIGFENMDISLRYIFVNLLLLDKTKTLVDTAKCLSEEVKTKIKQQYETNDVTFASISKHIILPIVSRKDYKGFNNTRPMTNMPNVLFIGSHMREEMRGGLFSAPQLGLFRISSYLEAFGVSTTVYDVEMDGIEKLENILRENNYDFVGFNVLYPSIKNTIKLMYRVRALAPDSVFIGGGQGAAFSGDELASHTPLQIIATAFGEFPMLDMTMTYEYERSIEQFKYIKGLYLKSADGESTTTGFIPEYTPDDLRVLFLTVDYKAIPYERYWEDVQNTYSGAHMKVMKANDYSRTVRLYCETHCPMGCDFCSSTRYLDNACGKKHKVHMISAEDIGLAIGRATTAHPDTQAFYFNDDTFMFGKEGKQRAVKLCDIVDRDFKTKHLKFIGLSRADDVNYNICKKDDGTYLIEREDVKNPTIRSHGLEVENILKRMQRSGFGIINYGIESFSDKTLRDIGKKLQGGSDMGRIAVRAIENTLAAGVTPRINFILFYPTIKMDDLEITIDTAAELIGKGAPPTYYTYIELFPGAQIMEKYGGENYRDFIEYDTFRVNGDGHEFRFPRAIHPFDQDMRELAKDALAMHDATVEEFKQRYNWQEDGRLPTSMDTLILFYDLYRLAAQRGLTNKSADRILEIIDQLMQTKEQRKMIQNTEPLPLDRVNASIEILEGYEAKVTGVLAKANELLSTTTMDTSRIRASLEILNDQLEKIRKDLDVIEQIRSNVVFDNPLLDKIINVKEAIQALAKLQKEIATRDYISDSTDIGQRKLKDLTELKEHISSVRTAISRLQDCRMHYQGFSDVLEKSNNLIIMADDITALPTTQIASKEQKAKMKDIIEGLQLHTNLILLASMDKSVLEDLPREAEFEETEKVVSPRVVYKSLNGILKYAQKEIQKIQEESNPYVRSLLFPNQSRRVQVGAAAFLFKKKKEWQGWIYDGNQGKAVYKDLIIEEVPAILSGLTHDLRLARDRIKEENFTITEAIESARKERAATTQKNVDFFEGWDPQERAYKTLRSRYGIPLLKLIAAFVLSLTAIGLWCGYHPGYLILKTVDTMALAILLGTLLYMAYTGVYGTLTSGGQYYVKRKDVISSLSPERLVEVLPDSARSRLETDNLTSTKDIISKLSDKEFYEVLKTRVVTVSLYVNSLSKKKKKDILLKLNVNIEQIEQMDDKVINEKVITIVLALLDKSRNNWTDTDKNIINDIFPLQVIVIPAINDPNIIELMELKVKLVDYPNVLFLLALEERDKGTIEIIEKAQKEGKIPSHVVPFFGAVDTANKPGQQRKPQNKPKNVNKTMANMLAVLEGTSLYPKLPIGKWPDLIMNWDLEDDPGELQLWSMITAYTDITTTVEELKNTIQQNGTFGLDNIKPGILKKNNLELYNQSRRLGIDLAIPKRVAARYRYAMERINNMKFADSQEKLKHLIMTIGVQADIKLFENIEKGFKELEVIAKRGHKYDVTPEKLERHYKRLLLMLDKKYLSEQSFVLTEFERRVVPVDYQAILISKMYGENQMSPLEWMFWFNLTLPGISTYKFDLTIVPTALIGTILGSISYGLIGGLAGTVIGMVIGYIVGKTLQYGGIDTQNRNGLAFSAGTANNFTFDTLMYYVSGYPEYNVAEDWSVGLSMAKMKFRPWFITNYGTISYQDSLPPLGPRWWDQHARWTGGHYQAFPQVLHDPIQKIKSFGASNWFHSFVCVVIFSLTPVLFAYALGKGLLTLIGVGIFGIIENMPVTDIFLLWIQHDIATAVILLLAGLPMATLLGLIPIIMGRPDEEEMLDKSITDLEKMTEEYRNWTNSDIAALQRDINELKQIAYELEAENDPNKVLERSRIYVQKHNELIKAPMKGKIKNLWEDPEMTLILSDLFLALSKVEEPWKELYKITQNMEQDLNEAIQTEIKKIERRVKQVKEGIISIGIFRIKIGKVWYAKLQKIFMNNFMIYYYSHSIIALVRFFKQAYNELDSHWRQTAHRLYGKKHAIKIKNVLAQKTEELKARLPVPDSIGESEENEPVRIDNQGELQGSARNIDTKKQSGLSTIVQGRAPPEEENVVITNTMEPDYITETSEEALEALTGENGTRKVSLMKQPCTIGMVIKAKPGEDLSDPDVVDRILEEHLAKEWSIIARKVPRKIAIERGVKVGNITYVIHIDNGTDKSLEEFAAKLAAANQESGNPKERTFAWVLSNELRKEDNEALEALSRQAHLVGLEGEFVPVSWQMLLGPQFANLIYSRHTSDGSPEDQRRINAIVDGIIKHIDKMAKGAVDLKEWETALKTQDLTTLFNGIKLVLPLPRPLIGDIVLYQKADKAIQTAL